MSIDHDIDRLYQLALSEFTAARNALAARAGSRATEIRRLPKPNAAAWAVNQIHWHRPNTRDRLADASRRLRRAHAQQLAGKAADVATAEAAHRAAITSAVRDARDLLQQAGDTASSSTLQAVTETLQTVIWQELNGRLSRPLKPTGLEALAVLKSGSLAGRGRAADIVPFRTPQPAPAENKVDRARREAGERRRETTEITRQLRAARAAERHAAARLTRAQKAAAAADRQRTDLIDALERTTSRLLELRAEEDEARKTSQRATAERTRLDERRSVLERES